jgi:hypothetical protein
MRRLGGPVLAVISFLALWPPAGAGAAGAASSRPDLEKQVRALVRQLGDPEFARREAAERELLRLGEAVVPVLDRLGPQDDAEVRTRLARVRRALVGFRDDLRAALAATPDIPEDTRLPIPEELRLLVVGNQPRSGDHLLSLIAQRRGKLYRPAVNAFVQTWDSMSAAQIDAYLRHALVLAAPRRERYPQGVDAGIGFLYHLRHGYGSWPAGGAFQLTMHTRHFLDGKPYGRPYDGRQPISTTGWVWTKDLALGKHTCAMEVSYEFTHHGGKRTGRLRSPEFAFTMVSADTPDDLVAPQDDATERLVRKALRFAERESAFNPPVPRPGDPFEPDRSPRRPQITWEGPGGGRAGIAAVYWNLAVALPVDLCFEVELHDLKTGKVYPCDPLVMRKGQAHWGYVSPRDAVGFALGRTGVVPVRVVLKPSRKVALTSTEVARYYPGSIRSEVLTVEVFDNDAGPGRRERK